MATDVASNMKAGAEALVMAFDGQWTTEAALAPRADNCEHVMIPASLGVPKKSNAEWAARFEHVKHLILESTMTIDDLVVAPEDRRAVVRTTLEAKTKVGPYHNEYVWFLTFDESGKKIVRITEFMDTNAVQDLRTRLDEARLRDPSV